MKKYIFMILFCLALLSFNYSYSNAELEKVSNHKPSKNSIQGNSIEKLDKITSELLADNMDGSSNTDERIDLINKIQKFIETDSMKATLLLLRLFQYSGAADSEYAGELLNNIFYSNPEVIIQSLSDIEGLLFDNFKNQQFIDLLIDSSCQLPQDITENPDYQNEDLEKDKKRILSVLNGVAINDKLKSKIFEIIKNYKI